MSIIINETLDYMDMEGMLSPRVSVDEYESHIGTNSEIVTLAFTIRGEYAGKDLARWFEKRYDWVLDGKVSDGEISNGRYLVFVELARRRSVPERIIELLYDLKTLTGLSLNDWTIVIDGDDYEPDLKVLEKVIITVPHEYRMKKENEQELNEMRMIADLKNINIYPSENNPDLINFRTLAGL